MTNAVDDVVGAEQDRGDLRLALSEGGGGLHRPPAGPAPEGGADVLGDVDVALPLGDPAALVGGRPVRAQEGAAGGDPVAEGEDGLGAVLGAVAAEGGLKPRLGVQAGDGGERRRAQGLAGRSTARRVGMLAY